MALTRASSLISVMNWCSMSYQRRATTWMSTSSQLLNGATAFLLVEGLPKSPESSWLRLSTSDEESIAQDGSPALVGRRSLIPTDVRWRNAGSDRRLHACRPG